MAVWSKQADSGCNGRKWRAMGAASSVGGETEVNVLVVKGTGFIISTIFFSTSCDDGL